MFMENAGYEVIELVLIQFYLLFDKIIDLIHAACELSR